MTCSGDLTSGLAVHLLFLRHEVKPQATVAGLLHWPSWYPIRRLTLYRVTIFNFPQRYLSLIRREPVCNHVKLLHYMVDGMRGI